MKFLFLSILLTSSTLRMIGPEDVDGTWREIIRRFNERYPQIHVEYISGPWSTDERQNMYIRSFLGKDPIEIVYMDVTWTARFAEKGWLLPLDKWFDAEKQKNFLPGDIKAGFYKGHIYRVPVRSDVGVLFYRKDLISKPPKTWEEFEKICEKMSNPPDLYCIVFQGMQYEGLVCNFFEYLWGAGGEWNDLSSLRAISALKFMRKIIERGWAPEGVLSFQEQQALEFFSQGKAIFMRNWPYAWAILNSETSKLKGKVGIAPFIHKKGESSAGTLGGWGLGIAKGTPDPESAWKFIEFVAGETAQKILHFKKGALPSLKSLYFEEEVLKANPHYPDLYRALMEGRPRPVHPDYPRISDVIQKHVSAVLLGIESPEKAGRIMQSSIRGIVEGRRTNWFKRLFVDYDLHRTILNTIIFTAISVPLELILGLAIALLINLPLKGRNFIRLSVLIPWALPTAVMAMSWGWMLNNPFGVINDFLVKLGIIKHPIDWLSTPNGAILSVILADVWKTTPFVTIILLAGLQSIPEELSASISVDGAGPFSSFFHLTLPLLLPFIRVAIIFRIIHASGIFDLIWVLTKGGPADSTKTIAIYIYNLALRYDETVYALFLTLLFLIALMLLSFAVIKATTLKYEKIK